MSSRLIAEHTRCCVLASQCQQQTATSNAKVQKLSTLLLRKIEQRRQLQLELHESGPLASTRLSITASVLSALTHFWALAVFWLLLALYRTAGDDSRADALRPQQQLRCQPTGGGVVVASAAAVDPLQDTTLLEAAHAELLLLSACGPASAGAQARCDALGGSLLELQRRLEQREDYAGATIVGGGVALALERSTMLSTLADAERSADSTTRDGCLAAPPARHAPPQAKPSYAPQAPPPPPTTPPQSEVLRVPLKGALSTAAAGWQPRLDGGRAQDSASATPPLASSLAAPLVSPLALPGGAKAIGEGGAEGGAEDEEPPLPSRASVPSISDFQIIRPISKGAFGRVYLARKKRTGDFFAVKVQRKDLALARGGANAKRVLAERDILVQVSAAECRPSAAECHPSTA